MTRWGDELILIISVIDRSLVFLVHQDRLVIFDFLDQLLLPHVGGVDGQHEQQGDGGQRNVDVGKHHRRCVDEMAYDDRHEHEQQNAHEQQVQLYGVGDHNAVLDVAQNERVGRREAAADHEHRYPGNKFGVHREEGERYVAEQGH